jgi:hypothetical protein
MKAAPLNRPLRSEVEVWGSVWGVGPSTTNDSIARQGLSARLEVQVQICDYQPLRGLRGPHSGARGEAGSADD